MKPETRPKSEQLMSGVLKPLQYARDVLNRLGYSHSLESAIEEYEVEIRRLREFENPKKGKK